MEIRDVQERLIRGLYPEIWSESLFVSPVPMFHIPAETVFDHIRQLSDPAMTEEEFNNLIDEVEEELLEDK